MGIRVTGISTPVGGLSWEYTRSDKQNIPLIISPGQKIKVFISSICGVEKYDKVRAELKSAIEATQLADAYTFESKGASTLTAGDHYTFALEESDICIFLIDNADGIRPRVQGEIDTVKKYNIKALYYFCDENQKEKTALEQSLMGAHLAKSKTVHSFSELSKDGAQALIEDIIAIYHYYCKGRQNYAITEEMDKKIAEYLPSYYGDTYRLEITENENEDMPGFVREYAERIRKSNETQGKNGIFFGHGTREIATVRAILLEKEFVCDSEIIDVLISTVADTLLISKESIATKLDAIALLIV